MSSRRGGRSDNNDGKRSEARDRKTEDVSKVVKKVSDLLTMVKKLHVRTDLYLEGKTNLIG